MFQVQLKGLVGVSSVLMYIVELAVELIYPLSPSSWFSSLTRRRRKQDEGPEGPDPNRQSLQPLDEQALWTLQSKAEAQLQ